MFLSLLFDQQDQLIAAAPGCDQQPLGNEYWRTFYPQALPAELGETAILDIQSNELTELLLGLAYTPESLATCRARLAAYEHASGKPRRMRAA